MAKQVVLACLVFLVGSSTLAQEAPAAFTCTDLNAMDATTSVEFLKGYLAGRQDLIIAITAVPEGAAPADPEADLVGEGVGPATFDGQDLLDACKVGPDGTLNEAIMSLAGSED